MVTDLFPYQETGARWLASRGKALLADDMGLGKTAQAIAAVREICPDGRWLRVVVVCPASVCQNWRREFDKFWSIEGGRAYAMTVQSYDNLVRNGFQTHELVGRFAEIDVLILDEAHYLKSRTAKRTKAIFGPECDGVGGLVERAKHVFLLTGTPTPNNPSEMWPMLRAVMPGAIESDKTGRPLSYWQFINKYCHLRDNSFGAEIVKGKNLGELRERIAPYVLRRKKEDVLKDLPPIRFDQLYLDGDLTLPAEALPMVEDVERALMDGGIAALAKIAPHVATLRRLTGLAKVKPAVEWIRDWLDAGGKKLVVFAWHLEVIDRLAGSLSEVSYPQVVTGDVPSDERQARVDRFQNDPKYRIFIGQIQAAGTGITLHAASDVLFVESSWVPSDNEQAAMRIHRIGQKNACLVRFATLAGSVDERIQRAVLRKAADIARLFD